MNTLGRVCQAAIQSNARPQANDIFSQEGLSRPGELYVREDLSHWGAAGLGSKVLPSDSQFSQETKFNTELPPNQCEVHGPSFLRSSKMRQQLSPRK